MKPIRLLSVLMAVAFVGVASAQEAQHRNGDHPAVIVKRMAEKQGYDYAAQFYPHPAWLYLSSTPSHEMMDHPAVIISKRERQRQIDLAAKSADDATVSDVH